MGVKKQIRTFYKTINHSWSALGFAYTQPNLQRSVVIMRIAMVADFVCVHGFPAESGISPAMRSHFSYCLT